MAETVNMLNSKVSVALALLMAAGPAQAAIPISGTVTAWTWADGFGVNFDADEWLAEAPRAVSATAAISGTWFGVVDFSASETIAADWASPLAGSATLDWGLGVRSTFLAGDGTPFVGTGSNTWQYYFQATDNGWFDLDYTIARSGFTGGLGSLHGGSQLNLPGLDGFVLSDPAGSLTVPLVAGQRYWMTVSTRARHGGYMDYGTGSASAALNWRIRYDSPTGIVPEPGTWAMLIVGFGLVGLSMRQRASQPA